MATITYNGPLKVKQWDSLILYRGKPHPLPKGWTLAYAEHFARKQNCTVNHDAPKPQPTAVEADGDVTAHVSAPVQRNPSPPNRPGRNR